MSGKERLLRASVIVGAAAFALACIFMLFLPLPARMEAAEERYVCVWESGEKTEENYVSAYRRLAGAEADRIVLRANGREGFVTPSTEYRNAFELLRRGNLGELLTVTPAPNRLESAALFRAFGDFIWYDNGYFIWDGEKITRTAAVRRETFVLLDGSVSAEELQKTGAQTLAVRSAAELTASAFVGTELRSVQAEEPYISADGALYRHTPGGTRLVAGLPFVRSLAVEDCAWADEGALRACTSIAELTLPFVGNTLYANAGEYTGELAWLFLTDGEYRVPDSLKKLTVTGGTIAAYAFYGCDRLEEISACGLAAENVARDAFLGCTGWQKIHSPNAEVRLVGAHTATPLPCGCTLFGRIAG